MNISSTDLKCEAVRKFGVKPSSEQIRQFLNNTTNSEMLTAERLKKKFIEYLQRKNTPLLDDNDRIRRMFLAFDFKGQGFISCDDLFRVCKQVLPHMKQERVREIFQEVDLDNDGCITFKDFQQMMGYSP